MAESRSWVDRANRRLARWCERGIGKRWVVAVSGGGDSTALLRLLHQLADGLGVRLSVAHLDHGVRGELARADAAFVAELAKSLGLPFDLGSWKPTRTGHFESDARRARYHWLTTVAQARGASVIAVGHTRDDQAETILHRILRGTGLRGLAGMPTTRVLASEPRITLVRPLLQVSRRELRDYLAVIDQPFRDDATNADVSRTRARIRHDLLPKLAAEYNLSVVPAVVRLGAIAASVERAQKADLQKLEQAAVIACSPDSIVLKHGFLRSAPVFQRTALLRRLWRNAGWPEASMSARRWCRIAALVGNENISRVDVGVRVEVSTERSFLMLRRLPAPSPSSPESVAAKPIPLTVPGATPVSWAGGLIETFLDRSVNEPCCETVDLESVSLPLLVRALEPGDRFDPLGMSRQSMALADFFRGRHVGRAQRARIPLVCDQTGIIWVVGHRIADRVKRSATTRRTLGLRWCVHDAKEIERPSGEAIGPPTSSPFGPPDREDAFNVHD
jgi:tRNA(Ile)-lysidine synthase